VGKITRSEVRKIAELKLSEMNAASLEAAELVVAGTARSMGIDVIGG
jgi:large subunit ribosomal protein L11